MTIGKRKIFHLIGPDGMVIASAGKRWMLEEDLKKGWTYDSDENDELVRVVLPPDTRIVEISCE